jgi:lipopolysaccharide transport system permease protein
MSSEQELIIERGSTDRHFWSDLWRYRELFMMFAWRDVAVRYKQTAIGLLWALFRPMLTIVVFTVIFGKIAALPSEGGAPYALMVLAGLLPWHFFATALSDASNSVVGNAGLIGKVYFPRVLVPVAAMLASFVDFLVSLLLLIALMLWYDSPPTWRLVSIVAFGLLTFAASLGPALWFAALNAKYRDFRYIIPVLLQFGLFVSPVGFSSAVVPENWRLLYALNPMVGIIDGFRWAILGGQTKISWVSLVIGVLVIVILLWFGVRRFRRTERVFADVM